MMVKSKDPKTELKGEFSGGVTSWSEGQRVFVDIVL